MGPASSLLQTARSRAKSAASTQVAWTPGRLLSQSRWTAIYEAQPETGSHLVLKTVRSGLASDHDRFLATSLLRREAEIGRTVNHRHLVPTLETIDGERPWLVQPLLPDARSAAAIVAWPLAARLWVIRQTAEALSAMHRAGWLHGNVTPIAIVVTPSGHATLLELGWSRQLGSEECNLACTNFVGNLRYAPPELFDDTGRVTPAADVYSLGAVLFQLLTGHSLWTQYTGPELIAAKRTLSPPEITTAGIPFTVATLTRTTLNRDPLRRPTLQAVIETLVAAEIETISK